MDNLSSVGREALRYLGYKGQVLESDFIAKVNSLEKQMVSSCTPRNIVTYYTPSFSEDGIYLSPAMPALKGKDIRNHLNGAEKVAVILCTLGSGFDSALMRLERISMTDATVFNALGSAYIEKVADDCERRVIEEQKSQGLFTNYRFSPGYGDLPIEVSKSLIDASEAQKKIGLTITEDFILIPRKSVTAVMGVFDKGHDTEYEPCDICSLRENCVRRREGNYCGRFKK